MQYKKGICSCCGKERYIINVSKNLCAVGVKERSKAKRVKSVNKVSIKQGEIKALYKQMCEEMDNDISLPKVCTGCGKSYREVRLSHSHLISRQDCHNIGRTDLIYDRRNVTYHCMSIGEHKGCHEIWESKQRNTLLDYQKNIEYISEISSELYFKYKIN